MKKLNIFCKVLIFSLFLIMGVGCKSTPVVQKTVHPLNLIDNNSSFYLKIPTKQDKSLVASIVEHNIKDVSESDANLIAERIDTIYLGINKRRKSTEFQLAASCSIPKIAVSKLFTKKNGWNSEKLILQNQLGDEVEYKVFDNSELLLSLPSQNLVVLGRAVPSMVEVYNTYFYEIENGPVFNLNPLITEWFAKDDDAIRFFATKPQSFLTILTGANLNYKLVYVCGTIISDTKRDDQYIMNLEFEFREKKVVPAAKAALSLAFGLTNSEVYLETPTHLVISNIKISKKELYKILVLK